MNRTPARITSLAIGSTIAILYSLCAATMAAFPSVVPGMAKSIAHGVNLNALEIGSSPFTFGSYLTGLICITAYALIWGYIYGSIRNSLIGLQSENVKTISRTTAARV